MQKYLWLSLLALLAGPLLLPAASYAASADCAQVENARDRLACFDQQFPRDTSQPNVLPDERAESKPSPTLRPSEGPVITQAPSRQPTRTAEQPKPAKKGLGGILDWPTEEEQAGFESTIAAIRIQDKTKMVFRLENGQIWLQSSPRELPFRKGDKVEVKAGTVGGFIMRSENGTTTRVKRLK